MELDPRLEQAIAIAAVAVNAVTFVAFGLDKRKARKGRRRTPEAVLLGLSAAGGAVGGWLGMFTFRHKTRKVAFLVPMVLATALTVVWAWWLGWLG